MSDDQEWQRAPAQPDPGAAAVPDPQGAALAADIASFDAGEHSWLVPLLRRGPDVMPDEVWRRLAQALRDEAVTATSPEPVDGTAGQVVALQPRRSVRRRWTQVAGGLVAASAALLLGGVALQAASTSNSGGLVAGPPPDGSRESLPALAVLRSGTDYRAATLDDQVRTVLVGVGLESADRRTSALAEPAALAPAVMAPSGFTSSAQAVAQCVSGISRVAQAQGIPVATPALLVDRGTFDGQPVGIVVLLHAVSRAVHVFVVGPGCSHDDPAIVTSRALR